jgi:hypothetical protein
MRYQTSASTILAVTFLLLSTWPGTVHAERQGCDEAMTDRAWLLGAHLKTWEQIYDYSFKRYPTCDDGVIAEAYSDAIVKMLADRWEQFPALGL